VGFFIRFLYIKNIFCLWGHFYERRKEERSEEMRRKIDKGRKNIEGKKRRGRVKKKDVGKSRELEEERRER
jgi:hypothetical protein